jgi:dTDP-4-amino-4,6-dideoxygalactose transaminase
MPAFHCRSLVEPALYLHAEVLFYPLQPDLRPDLDQASMIMRVAGNTVKAMVVPHYFGYPQPLDSIADFCAEHGLDLVEDCAHAFYGRHNGRLLGTVGRFAVASPRKFFAIPDGGILLDNTPDTAINLEPAGQPWHRELKALVTMAMESWRHRQRHPGRLKQHDTALTSDRSEVAWSAVTREERPTAYETGLKGFVPRHKFMAGLRISRYLMNSAAHARIAQARRDNYRRWLADVKGVPGCHPLFEDLPDEVVPYAFPLLLDRPEAHFPALKRRGIPIWRWEDTAVTGCEVSNRYRLRLLQLPCHQDLTEVELAWMIQMLQDVLN